MIVSTQIGDFLQNDSISGESNLLSLSPRRESFIKAKLVQLNIFTAKRGRAFRMEATQLYNPVLHIGAFKYIHQSLRPFDLWTACHSLIYDLLYLIPNDVR